ncbi:MAG: alpha/beta fold hydrolase [Bacteroidota bacterium]
MKLIYSLFFTLLTCYAFAQETIEFPSEDGLVITADYYPSEGSSKLILLFHQAGWSRGEYKEIAPKLNQLGYNCLAVDQRSGGQVNGITNETNKRAKADGKETNYSDAFQDIVATVAYAKKQYKPSQLIIWGSSYSSALVLKYAGDYPDQADAVLSFSPGEYFGKKDFISSSASNIRIPSFITSAASEKNSWWNIHEVIKGDQKVYFLPDTKGNHGSRALWEKFEDSDAYWNAMKKFLKGV